MFLFGTAEHCHITCSLTDVLKYRASCSYSGLLNTVSSHYLLANRRFKTHSCRMLPQLQDVATAAGCCHSCRMSPQLQVVATAAGCCQSCRNLRELQHVATAAACRHSCRMLPSVQDVARAAGCCHSCSMSSIAAGCRHSCRHSPGGSRRRSVQFASGCGPRHRSALATIGPAQRPTRRGDICRGRISQLPCAMQSPQ